MEMEQNEEKKRHGGKREGAGRKRSMGRAVGFRATPEAEAILAGVEHQTDFINAAIVFYKEHGGH